MTQDAFENRICEALEVDGREVREFHWGKPIGGACNWYLELVVGDLVGISLTNISNLPGVILRHIDRDSFENDPDPREEGRMLAVYCVHGKATGKGVAQFVERTTNRKAVAA